MQRANDIKLKAQRIEYGKMEADKALYHAIHAAPAFDRATLIEAFLAEGGKIKRCKKGKRYSQSKRGSAILGPETAGRADLWGGRRWIYGR